MQNFAPFKFAGRGAPGPSGVFAREISNLLVPAVTKASIDLWIAIAGLTTCSYAGTGAGTSLKENPYEVTIVQSLFEIIVARQVHGTPVWEAGFKSTAGPGAPVKIDLVLEDPASTATDKLALLEFGVNTEARPRFNAKKIKDDLTGLASLNLLGVPVTGMKQVYYITVAQSAQANVYKHFMATARAAEPSAFLGARRFPIFSPGGWMYATVAAYE